MPTNNADFTPTIDNSAISPSIGAYKATGSFRFWAQKVLPLVYDDSLSYYELLCKVVNYLNDVIENVDTLNDSVNSIDDSFGDLQNYVNSTKDELISTYNELQSYVNNYFASLDIQDEINNKLDVMASDGTLIEIISPIVPSIVTGWLDDNITPTSPPVDATLSISGAAADAKVTGDNFTQLNNELYFATSNTNEAVKTIGYKLGVKAIFSQNENFRLESDGRGTTYSGCKIVRYKVTAGDMHYIKMASNPNIPTTFVFKNSDSAVNTNNVGDCHHGAYDGFVTVPTGASYLFICKLSSDDVSNVYNVTKKKINQLMNGVVFIYLSGGKICVRCTTTARAVIEGQYVNLSAMSTDLERSTATDAVLLTASGFSVKQITAVQEGDLVVAWVYQNTVYTFYDECVWANIPPIGHLVQRSSIPIFINNKKLRHYDVGATSSSRVTNYGSFIKILNGYGSGMPIAYIDRQNGKQYGIPGSITQNSSDISGKKVLCIGDSITNRGWYQQRIKSHVGSVEFIGTRNTQHNNLLCEGYSGCNAKTVLSESTITPYGESAIANPFWDSANNRISFSYYCNNLGASPDMVVIEFGLNETNATDYMTAIQNFIDNIKSYNSAITVYVVQPFPEADMGASNRTVYSRNFALKQCVLEAESFTDCTIIPCWYIMVDELDYQTAMLDCGYGNVQVQGLADAVHPAETTGFAKLGDMIYNYLGV